MLQGVGVQLYIEIKDADPPGRKPDELVDILLIDHNEPVGEESATQVHSGMYEFVSMKLVITVTCIENFQGSDCSQCVPGFTGPDCQQINYCVGVICNGNGQCVDGLNSFDCSCVPGFTGELCQTNIGECVGISYSGNGECLDGVNSFTCECSPGSKHEIKSISCLKPIMQRSNSISLFLTSLMVTPFLEIYTTWQFSYLEYHRVVQCSQINIIFDELAGF